MNNRYINSLIYCSLLISTTIFCHNIATASAPHEALIKYTKDLQATVTQDNAQQQFTQSIYNLSRGLDRKASTKKIGDEIQSLVLSACILQETCHTKGANIEMCGHNKPARFCSLINTYIARHSENLNRLSQAERTSYLDVMKILQQHNMLDTPLQSIQRI